MVRVVVPFVTVVCMLSQVIGHPQPDGVSAAPAPDASTAPAPLVDPTPTVAAPDPTVAAPDHTVAAPGPTVAAPDPAPAAADVTFSPVVPDPSPAPVPTPAPAK